MSSPTKVPANMTSGVIKTADKASATGTSGSSQVGAVVQLNSSEKIPSQYLSTGVHLGGIAAANLLDDYEEGTFTLVGNSNMTINAISGAGNYTKIGNRVFCNYFVRFTHTGTDDVKINLPFSAAADVSGSPNIHNESANVVWIPGISGNIAMGYVASGNSHMNFYNLTGSGLLGNDDMPATAEIYASISYMTDQ